MTNYRHLILQYQPLGRDRIQWLIYWTQSGICCVKKTNKKKQWYHVRLSAGTSAGVLWVLIVVHYALQWCPFLSEASNVCRVGLQNAAVVKYFRSEHCLVPMTKILWDYFNSKNNKIFGKHNCMILTCFARQDNPQKINVAFFKHKCNHPK